VNVTVGVIDFSGVFKDVSLSTEHNHSIFLSTWSQLKAKDKHSVTAFSALVRGPTARELKAVGLT
jgi:hypothetical protein